MPLKSETELQAKEIFLAALKRDEPDDRQAFLDEACRGDEALASEVKALLHEHEEMEGEFLESPAMVPGDQVTRTGSSASRETEAHIDSMSGKSIGHYKLMEMIGEGGSGVVYLAQQEAPVRRRVALKILKLGMDTRSVIARFESERQALALMEHPNIARVFDAGSTDRGRPYFVMELVRGMPITKFCNKAELGVRKRISLFIRVCQAVQHAHQKGIIHRDLKPSNILVAFRDGDAVPKIIDFGVAKATEQRLTDKTLFTHSQTFIGTPAYMSPEQAELGTLDIDTRSDLYALGVLLYELFAGSTPFDVKMLEKVGLDEFRRTIREDVPPKPSTRIDQDSSEGKPGRIASREIRGDLDWIVMQCLEKDRHRRYPTVNALALDLERYLAGETVTARPPTMTYRMSKLVRRHQAAFATAAALVIALVAGASVSTYQALRASNAEGEARQAQKKQSELRAQAELDRENAELNAARARLNEYVADIQVAHLALAAGNFAKAADLLERHIPSRSSDEDLRGFEWHYLMDQCEGDDHFSFPQQSGPVRAIAFSPDGELVATGTRKELRIWNLAARAHVNTLPGGATSMAFLPDSKTLVAAASGGVWILNTSDWSDATELTSDGDTVAISADGSRLATAGRAGVQIWDTDGWIRLHQLSDASGPLAFSPDGKTLATNGKDGIKLWSVANGKSKVTLKNSPLLLSGFFQEEHMLTFSSDGKSVIAPHNTKSDRGIFFFSIWDADTGEETATIPPQLDQETHTGLITNVGFAGGGRFLATGSWDHTIRLWDFETHRTIAELRGHRGEIWSLAVSPDGKTIASGSKNGEIKLWPATTPNVRSKRIAGKWTPVGFSQDGRQVAAFNRDDDLTFFDLATSRPVKSLSVQAAPTSFGSTPNIALSSDGGVLAECTSDGDIIITDTRSKRSRRLDLQNRKARSLALSPEGESILVRTRRGLIIWREVRSGSTEAIATFQAERAIFSADGGSLAVLPEDGPVEIWDTMTRSLRVSISREEQSFGSQAHLSPDGLVLAMSRGIEDFENSVTLWDTITGELLGTCTGHMQPIWSVAFSPDGRTMATSSSDSTLKLWNVATRRELLSLRQLGATLTNLRFSPDGQYLVAGSPPFAEEGELQLFHAPSTEPAS